MTLQIELDSELEERLQRDAEQRGVSVSEAARLLIEEGLTDTPKTPAETIAYWKRVGVLGAFADRPDSPEFARQLRQQASSRKWE